MTALSSAIDESRSFEIGDEIPHLRRHERVLFGFMTQQPERDLPGEIADPRGSISPFARPVWGKHELGAIADVHGSVQRRSDPRPFSLRPLRVFERRLTVVLED